MKKIITTSDAPQAIGPYSQAVSYGDMVFVSGQLAIDPKTGNRIDGDIEKQTKRVMENLKTIIEASGMTMENVLKCTCFLKNIEDFARFNTVYGSYFKKNPPVRETIEVSRLPKDGLVEISAICGK
ncbi:MAG: reactive intermediate/imine deaminase [Deltaproteobacteria bacterium RBG_13_49_15]|nr:MAG: reactive intermediate/imine deaminase [Deltaproteobacteria bacterium RBG_13_49_15]